MTAFLNTAHKAVVNDRWIPWKEWKTRWTFASDMMTCLSLLHAGFQNEVASPEEEGERLRTFLMLADGYWNQDGVDHTERTIMRKAFTVLADHFHNGRILTERLLIMPPEAMRAVFHFFRPKTDYEGGGLENVKPLDGNQSDKDHAMIRMNEALLQWCKWVWFQDFSSESDFGARHVGPWVKDKRAMAAFETSRALILPILYAYGHGQLEGLLEKVAVLEGEKRRDLRYRVRWELFDDPCLAVLEQLAARSSGLVGPHTIGKAVSEALVQGSSAAKVVALVWAAQGKLSQKE